MGERDHAAWQAAILAYFLNHRREWKIQVFPELRIQVSPTRFRVPDVTVLDQDSPVEQIVTTPPIAVFEILSPEDTMSRILVKLADYEQMGIGNIFVVDPPSGVQYVYAKGSLERIQGAIPAGRVTVDFTEISKHLQ